MLGAPLHWAVPTDPGTLKLSRGPRMIPYIGLICCFHPCMGQKWDVRPTGGAKSRLGGGEILVWGHLNLSMG